MDADEKQEALLRWQLQDDLSQAAKERERNSRKLQADEGNARSTAAAEIRLLEQQLGVDAAQVDHMKDEELRALAAQDFQRAQEANARAKVYAAECSQRVQAATSQRNVQLQEQVLQLRTAARDAAAAAEKHVAGKRAGFEAALSDLLAAANQRLKDCDAMSASFSALNARARELLARQPAWPRHEALLRFDLPLQRLTTHFLVSKQWFPRYFSLRGSRLYYSDGKNGYPDTAQGTLAFMQLSPAPDGRYCVDLGGMCAAWRLSLQRLFLTPRAQAAVSRAAASLSMGRRSRSRSSFHQGTRCISVCMLALAHRSHAPSRRRGTCASLLPMTSRDSAACAPFKLRVRAAAAPRCRTSHQR
jgi:hypothetical protein